MTYDDVVKLQIYDITLRNVRYNRTERSTITVAQRSVASRIVNERPKRFSFTRNGVRLEYRTTIKRRI